MHKFKNEYVSKLTRACIRRAPVLKALRL